MPSFHWAGFFDDIEMLTWPIFNIYLKPQGVSGSIPVSGMWDFKNQYYIKHDWETSS